MKEYWYLREGDFRPEPVETICKNRNQSREEVLRFLSQNGNLFYTARAAEVAASVVRSCLLFQPWGKRIKEFHVVIDTSPEPSGQTFEVEEF